MNPEFLAKAHRALWSAFESGESHVVITDVFDKPKIIYCYHQPSRQFARVTWNEDLFITQNLAKKSGNTQRALEVGEKCTWHLLNDRYLHKITETLDGQIAVEDLRSHETTPISL